MPSGPEGPAGCNHLLVTILHNGRETITVFPEEQTTDSRGNPVWRPSSVGVVVHGVTMTQRASRDRGTDELRPGRQYHLLARDVPLGPWSRVEWNGRSLAVVDGPLRYTASPQTRHVSAILREER
jgi:hypothetical protein